MGNRASHDDEYFVIPRPRTSHCVSNFGVSKTAFFGNKTNGITPNNAQMETSSATKKTVVIIGLGYAGLSLAKLLDGDETIQVVAIDPRENFMLHKWGALRAAVAGSEIWKKRVLVPTNGKGMFKRARIVQDRVVSIKDEEKTIMLEKGSVVSITYMANSARARLILFFKKN